MRKLRGFWSTLQALFWTLATVVLLFLLASLGWIIICGMPITEYFHVLSVILSKAGSYSTLLTALSATVILQSYASIKNQEKEISDKIKDIGQFTLAFQLEENQGIEQIRARGGAVVITTDDDYKRFEVDITTQTHLKLHVKFLTSNTKPTNLKNILVFDDEYFQANRTRIINDYYGECNKIHFPNPLYCAARPTDASIPSDELNKYFALYLSRDKIRCGELCTMWVSTITEKGTLVFLRINYRMYYNDGERDIVFRLVNQLSYFSVGNHLRNLIS